MDWELLWSMEFEISRINNNQSGMMAIYQLSQSFSEAAKLYSLEVSCPQGDKQIQVAPLSHLKHRSLRMNSWLTPHSLLNTALTIRLSVSKCSQLVQQIYAAIMQQISQIKTTLTMKIKLSDCLCSVRASASSVTINTNMIAFRTSRTEVCSSVCRLNSCPVDQMIAISLLRGQITLSLQSVLRSGSPMQLEGWKGRKTFPYLLTTQTSLWPVGRGTSLLESIFFLRFRVPSSLS